MGEMLDIAPDRTPAFFTATAAGLSGDPAGLQQLTTGSALATMLDLIHDEEVPAERADCPGRGTPCAYTIATDDEEGSAVPASTNSRARHTPSPSHPTGAPRTTSGAEPPARFAALDVATGKVTGVYKNPAPGTGRSSQFLKHIARAYPPSETAPGDGTTTPPISTRTVRVWLGRSNPQLPRALHPDVRRPARTWSRCGFGIIDKNRPSTAARSPRSRDLMIKIRAFVTGWNPPCHPFIWTRPADEILDAPR